MAGINGDKNPDLSKEVYSEKVGNSPKMSECEFCRTIFVPKQSGQKRCSPKCLFETNEQLVEITPKSSRARITKRMRRNSDSSPGYEVNHELQIQLKRTSLEWERLVEENKILKAELSKLKNFIADKVIERIEIKPPTYLDAAKAGLKKSVLITQLEKNGGGSLIDENTIDNFLAKKGSKPYFARKKDSKLFFNDDMESKRAKEVLEEEKMNTAA